MELAELHPKLDGTVEAGHLTFDCPLGHEHTITIPIGSITPKSWASSGEFPGSLTLTPSIWAHNGSPNNQDLRDDEWDKAAKCGWHGFITNGHISTV